MASYIRRFLTDPGEEVLLEIESVNILDLDPPASITGIGTGTACIVGEFENGQFAATSGVGTAKGVLEATSATDLKTQFGGFGYVYDGVPNQNPCARKRNADNAVVAETWNGNGIVQLSAKKFRRLIIARVDTSVGAVQFERLGYVKGAAAFRYDLEPAQTLVYKVDGAGAVTVTFTAAAATVTGAAGTFNPTSGETATLGYDAATDFVVTFLASDNTAALMAARINQYAGFTFADLNAGQVRLTGRMRGTSGQVRVVAGSAGLLAKLGHSVANTAGTGNVGNIDAVTVSELNTLAIAASATSRIDVGSDSKIRLTSTTANTGTIEIVNTTTATGLGFPIVTGTAANGNVGVIPAGTRVRVSAGQRFVTMQELEVTAASPGPYLVKVRHATDDGTGLSAIAGAITSVEQQPDLDSFAVINLLPVSAALTDVQIDVAYLNTIAATIDLNNVSREINIIFSARQSNVVRQQIKQNVIDASASGCFGRVCCIRPPLGITRTVAMSTAAEPGVGTYRNQRVIYNYPGVRAFVPAIAATGLAGGTGFTVDGYVDIGSDGFCASVLSQLAPEENPGQLTEFLGGISSLESSSNAQNFTITDYTNFKRSGICAPRFDEGTAIFQSGVTSVDPTVFPNLKNIARRRMADFIQDTLARRLKSFGKKLSTRKRRDAITGEIRSFLNGLLGLTGGSQRIAGFVLDVKTGNTVTSLGKGLFRIILRVQTLASLDSIVLETTIGESVDISEAA